MGSPAITFAREPSPGTCSICRCTFLAPCLGGRILTPATAHVHRLVDDPELLPRDATCSWIDEDETICSAHTDAELEAAGLELPPGEWSPR